MFLFPAPVFADYGWEFDSYSDFQGWSGSFLPEPGGIVIINDGLSQVVSPEAYVPLSADVLLFRIKSPDDDTGIFALVSANTGAIYKKFFRLRKSGDFIDYEFYAGSFFPKGESVSRVIIQFPSGKNIRIDSIRFLEPSFPAKARVLWSNFWDPEIIKGSTIGFVDTPMLGSVPFISILYVIAAALFVCFFIIMLSKGWEKALPRAIAISFAIAGGLYALRMDANWLNMWKEDFAGYNGATEDERIARAYFVYSSDYAEFLDFLRFLEKTVPPGQTVRPAVKLENDVLAITGKYFIMPVLTSPNAKYLWAFKDQGLFYDPAEGTLLDNGKVVASRVRLSARRGAGAIYELADEVKR